MSRIAWRLRKNDARQYIDWTVQQNLTTTVLSALLATFTFTSLDLYRKEDDRPSTTEDNIYIACVAITFVLELLAILTAIVNTSILLLYAQFTSSPDPSQDLRFYRHQDGINATLTTLVFNFAMWGLLPLFLAFSLKLCFIFNSLYLLFTLVALVPFWVAFQVLYYYVTFSRYPYDCVPFPCGKCFYWKFERITTDNHNFRFVDDTEEYRWVV